MAIRRPNRQAASTRRAEVLDAARDLFFHRGYRGTSVEQIAKRAGYSKRTVYLDYLNKDDLFIAVCEEGGKLLLQKLHSIPAEATPPEEVIDRFLDVFISFSRNHREYFRMIFGESTPDIIANCSPEVRRRVAELERTCFGVLVQWVNEAVRAGVITPVDAWATAGILVGSATGIVLLSMGGSQTIFSQESLEALMKQSLRTYWRGLQAGAPSSAQSD